MLFNGSADEPSCQGPCKTGFDSSHVTEDDNIQIRLDRGWAIVDTVGVGLSKKKNITPDQMCNAVRKVMKHFHGGLNCLVFVMRFGRVGPEDRTNMRMLLTLFKEDDLKNNGVLVLTFCEEDEVNKKEDLHHWFTKQDSGREDKETKVFINLFGNVVITNNSVGNRASQAWQPRREKCLTDLTDFILTASTRIRIKSEFADWSLKAIIQHLLEKLGDLLWDRSDWKIDLKDVVNRSGDGTSLPIYAGSCGKCKTVVDVTDLIKLRCNHSFHLKCIESDGRKPPSFTCLQCEVVSGDNEYFFYPPEDAAS